MPDDKDKRANIFTFTDNVRFPCASRAPTSPSPPEATDTDADAS